MPGHPETVLIGPVPVKLGGTGLNTAPPLNHVIVGNGKGGYKNGPEIPEGSLPFVYDDAVSGDDSNIVTTRSNQSPIDNTKHRIFNAGTTDGELGFGALDDGATILSGNDNTAAGPNATVGGGSNVTAVGEDAWGVGKNNIVGGEAASVEGANNLVNGNEAHGEGNQNLAGPPQVNATLVSGGTTLTIAGLDWTSYLPSFGTAELQDTVTGKSYPRTFSSIAYAAGNTTFDIDTPLPAGVTSVFVFCGAVGFTTHVEGQNNIALFSSDHAEGGGSIAGGGLAHAEGSSFALEENTHAEGSGGTAAAIGGHTEGLGNTVLGQAAHGEGAGGLTGGDWSHTEGLGCQTGFGDDNFTIAAGGTVVSITGDVTAKYTNSDQVQILYLNTFFPKGVRKTITSVPSFDGTDTTFSINSSFSPSATSGQIVDVKKAKYAHAEGHQTTAYKDSSHAQGAWSNALWEGGDAYASGKFTTPGDVQGQAVILRGSTPGLAPNETVALKFGDAGTTEIPLENNKTYAVRVDCVATEMAIAAGTPRGVFQSVAAMVHCKSDGTVLVIGPTAVFPQIEEAGFAGATLVLTGPVANVLRITFGTGGGNTTASQVGATARVTEVLHT